MNHFNFGLYKLLSTSYCLDLGDDGIITISFNFGITKTILVGLFGSDLEYLFLNSELILSNIDSKMF